ncbi:MAG: hypothetical protein EBW75_06255 [Actinobacteria bacterium]|nr:hypothetical protein [Actinomycetota bacterium]
MANTIQVDVVSAEEQIYSGPAEFVALPGEAGELGIYPRHTPLITRIRPGSVRIHTADGGELFRTNCAMCHNLAGQGGALTQGKYAPTVMGVEPKHIYEAMVTGPQAMPVFANSVLTHEEKLSVIKWIKFVETEPSLGGAALGRVGPVTEGAVGFILGLGILIGIAVWLTTKAR